MGRLKEGKSYSIRVCLYRFRLTSTARVPSDENVSFLLVQGGKLSHQSAISWVQEEKGGQKALLSLAVFQKALTQNNPYAKVAISVAYSATLYSKQHWWSSHSSPLSTSRKEKKRRKSSITSELP